MSMVVQHNLSSMNTNRQLGISTGELSKSTEKLSSGYRINRAGDDAAGLKISEKMRSQIRDVDMAAEMVQYSKSNILSQAGQSMLAQANQSTQGVLSLLR